MNFQHPCVCKRQLFALAIHTFVLLAPDESLGSLDICEWVLCCTSNGTKCFSPWWKDVPVHGGQPNLAQKGNASHLP